MKSNHDRLLRLLRFQLYRQLERIATGNIETALEMGSRVHTTMTLLQKEGPAPRNQKLAAVFDQCSGINEKIHRFFSHERDLLAAESLKLQVDIQIEKFMLEKSLQA